MRPGAGGATHRFALLAALLSLLVAGRIASAEERIRSFDSLITVHAEGTLDVHETIRVNAEHRSITRGIFRDFPTVYQDENGRQIIVGFQFGLALRDGQPEQWRVESRSNGVRIYLGSPDRKVSIGEHTYEIVYHTDRQMGFFDDHDELYWNATGNGWDFPIDHATARVLLPDTIPRDQIKLDAYTGPQGAQGAAFTASIDANSPYFATTQPLGPREGLTIVAMWPKGFITQPVEGGLPHNAPTPGQTLSASGSVGSYASAAPIEKLLRRPVPHNPLPLFIAVLGFAFVTFRYYRAWDRVGRDPPGRVIIPEYEPPPDLSPAAMRYLIKWGGDNTGFTAAVLSLAVKGHLRIDQSQGFLGFGKTYVLTKDTRPNAKSPSADERALLDALFDARNSVELEKDNYQTIQRAIRMHGAELDRKYSAGYFSFNRGELAKGILLTALVFALTLMWPGSADSYPDWYFGAPLGLLTDAVLAATLISSFVWSKLLKAPTVEGVEVSAHILGFKQYLQVAEGEGLKNVTKPPPPLTPQLYEAYLPAALALGVEQEWGEQFVRVFDIQAPNYSPTWCPGGQFRAGSFVSFASGLSTSLSGAISSSSQAPGSHSGGRSGSSGGGGGGSSGGGGGGGGGGGW